MLQPILHLVWLSFYALCGCVSLTHGQCKTLHLFLPVAVPGAGIPHAFQKLVLIPKGFSIKPINHVYRSSYSKNKELNKKLAWVTGASAVAAFACSGVIIAAAAGN